MQKALCLIAAFGLLPQLMLAQGKSKEVEAQEYGLAAVVRAVVDQQQLPSDSAIGEGGVNALSQGGDVGWRLGVRLPPHRRKAIPWERGRPARILIPANNLPIHGRSLAKRTKPAFTGISSNVPGFVRARRPRSQVDLVRARRPRSQVDLVRARRPRSQVDLVRARRPRSQVVFLHEP